MMHRIRNIRRRLTQENLDGLILSQPANISYLTKYPSRDSYLLVSKSKNVYFTDSRYTQEAKKMLKGNFIIKDSTARLFKAISESCLELELKRIGFEERELPFAEYNIIKKNFGNKAELIPTHSLVEELRQIKDDREIEKIKIAIKICEKALRFAQGFITPGVKEIEVVGELEHFIRYNGAQNSSFDIIVASGLNSAYPHHISSTRELKNNEPVLIDIGIDYLGYKSDLTRVFFLGKISVLARKVFNIVREAQGLAIKQIKPHAPVSKVDSAARSFIAKQGYASYFRHNLGHGVGLEVHELPTISGRDEVRLEPGMIFTLEPAIYLPARFGIRIEDMVLVTKKGYEVLSGSSN